MRTLTKPRNATRELLQQMNAIIMPGGDLETFA